MSGSCCSAALWRLVYLVIVCIVGSSLFSDIFIKYLCLMAIYACYWLCIHTWAGNLPFTDVNEILMDELIAHILGECLCGISWCCFLIHESKCARKRVAGWDVLPLLTDGLNAFIERYVSL